MKSHYFGSGAGDGNSGITTIMIDFAETGIFKLVVRADKNSDLDLAVSASFTVTS